MIIHQIEAARLWVAIAHLGRDTVERETGLAPATVGSAIDREDVQEGTYFKIEAFLKRCDFKVSLLP